MLSIRDLLIGLIGFLLGVLLAVFISPYVLVHPFIVVGGLVVSFVFGLLIGRSVKSKLSLKGRVFEEPAALALVEIALKRSGSRE